MSDGWSSSVQTAAQLIDAALTVLDGNWRADHTVPSTALYPHQWSWDAAFIAIGRSWRDQPRAQLEIEHLFDGQWADGMVPHIVFNPAVRDDAYFPGPTFWRSDLATGSPRDVATSGITQPPLHARAVLEIVRHAPAAAAAQEFATRMYPKLVAQHRHLLEVRDVAGHGLVWSFDALTELAGLVGDDPAPHRTHAKRVRRGLRHRLWDPDARRFCARDVGGDRRSPEDTVTSLMPVLDASLPPSMVDAIAAVLDSVECRPRDDPDHFIAASYDLAARDFDPRRYWREPIWLNTDWLLWRGLRAHGRTRVADEIATSILRLVQRSGFREYFSPFGGTGYGSHDFSWTAAVVIDLLHRTGQAG